MAQPIRVVHFTKNFSPLTETFVYDSVRELERQGVDCRVLTLERVNAETRPFAAVDVTPRPSGWDVRSFPARLLAHVGLAARRSAHWPTLRRRLAARVRAARPDVIHAHFGPAAVLIAPVAARAGIPLVVSFYGFDISHLPRDPFWLARYRRLWEVTGAVTVLSREMGRRVVALGYPESRVHRVRLSRDASTLPTRPAPRRVSRFLSVGRLTEKKGHLDTIAAFRLLVESGSDVRLRIVGDGEERAALEAYIRAHDLGDRIELVGALENADVLREMAAADAFILCSRTSATGDQEGTPTVFVEAQAIGLPCVGTLHAGVPEMIPAENHRLLAPEGDVAGIADRVRALARLSADELAEVVAAGRRHVRSEFDLARETGTLKAIYASLLGPSSGGAGD